MVDVFSAPYTNSQKLVLPHRNYRAANRGSQIIRRNQPASRKALLHSRHRDHRFQGWDVSNSLQRSNPISGTLHPYQDRGSNRRHRGRHTRPASTHSTYSTHSKRSVYSTRSTRSRNSSSSRRSHNSDYSRHFHHLNPHSRSRRSRAHSGAASATSQVSRRSHVSRASGTSRPSSTRSNLSRHSRLSIFNGGLSRQMTERGMYPSLKEALLRNRLSRRDPDRVLSTLSEVDDTKRSELVSALSKLGTQPARIRPSLKLENESGKSSRSISDPAITSLPEESSSTELAHEPAVSICTDNKIRTRNVASSGTNFYANLKERLQSNDPIMKGYLVQRPKYWFGTKKRRYIVVRPSGLEIYCDIKSFEEGKLHSCHLLVGGRVSQTLPKQKKFAFASGQLFIRFIAESEESAMQWTESLAHIINNVTPGCR